VSANQRKQLPESRDSPQNFKKHLTYIEKTGLICRIYKELKTINTKGANNPANKLATELNRPFFKVLMANNI
jgi:hypothetical protein